MQKNYRSDIAFFFAVLLCLWIAYTVRDVLLLIYVSALFAVVVSPAIQIIRKVRIRGRRPSRGLAILVLVLLLALAGGLFVGFALPPVYRDASAFSADWPKHLAELTQGLQRFPFGNKLDPAVLQKYATEIVGSAGGIFLNLAGGIFGLFTAVILTIYFIVDGERAYHWAVSLFPLQHQERLAATLVRAERRMRHWLIGQAILMTCLGLASLCAFYVLGLKYFYLLALYAGIANIVPIAGPLSALAVASTVAAFDSPNKLLGVLVFYAIYLWVESGFLAPRIMKSTLDLSPLAVIIALALGGSLGGVLGALVAVPTAALVAVFADEYLVKRKSAGAAEK
ncbi:MAG TPA: AI-2E family transporter [Verrucomicrobiae bacterium]|nr:AI-2E family transporter [Verrucomicrobiae bacterium]